MKLKNLTNCLLALPVMAIFINLPASAGTFTYGNIAVLREGDGVDPLSTTSAPVAVLELTPAGSVVQTFNIPTNEPGLLTQSSLSSSEGFITRSVNFSNITFVGYDAPAGVANVPGTLANPTNREWGQLDLNGNYTRDLSQSSVAFSGSNVRSSVSDGTNYWMSGTASPTTSQEGIWYSPNGGAWIDIITTANINTRVTRIYNGSLYYSTSTGIFTFTNLPETGGLTAGAIGIAGSGSPYDFAINPAGNVCYVCDDSALTSGGGILKYTNNGTAWAKAFIFGATNGLTAGCRGLAVDFSGVNPVIYATTADTAPKVIEITDTSVFGVTNDITDHAIILASSGTYAIRGIALAPGIPTSGAPKITGVSPLILTNYVGLSSTFAVTANGSGPFSYQWYNTNGTAVSGQTNEFLTFTNSGLGNSGSYFAVVGNAFSPPATSSIVQLVIVPGNPNNLSVSPASLTTSAGSSATFTATVSGSPPFSYQWYNITNNAAATNLLSGQTNATLTVSNLLNGNTGGYYVVVTNIFSPPATSSVVTLTVTGDPHISIEPANTYGLVGGQVQFTVSALGTLPFSYQWYFADNSGNMLAPVSNGSGKLASGQSVVSGATLSTLTISNLQYVDLTNFIVVVTNTYGALTSSVAASPDSPAVSILGIQQTGGVLAFWDFNGDAFTNTGVNPTSVINPVPYLGVGSAAPVGTCNLPGHSPFIATTTVDPSGEAGNEFLGVPLPQPAFSWGIGEGGLPLTASLSANIANSNKLSGVQFNVSTVGAKNIKFGFDARATQTASEYERIQYTTNGTTWIDYPAATSFNNFAGSGDTGWQSYPNFDWDNFLPYDDYPDALQNYYDFTGFPGVANNPSFGLRIVVEYESTATYGVGTTNDFEGVGETYATGGNMGTFTYDLVTLYGDAITNNNVPPVISAFYTNSVAVTNQTTEDTVPITDTFTVSGDTTADKFTYSAMSLNPGTVNPSFSFTSNADGNCTITITPNPIAENVAAAPILVTVTDTNGDSSSAWFNLTVTTEFPSPTVTGLVATNTLANTTLKVPFSVNSSVDPASGFTYSTGSGNNTVIPAGSVSVSTSGGGATAANPILSIAPANNELGVAVVNVNVNDEDSTEQKITSVSIPIMVAPNTNIVALDYFNYDGRGGALDTVAGGFWQHLSGHAGQMQVTTSPTGGSVLVDTLNNTENLQTPLLGAPYSTSAGAPVPTLYYSFVVNMSLGSMPLIDGTYFAAFNDGQNLTADVDDCLVVATNGAAPGDYRLGISDDVGATAASTDTVMFPQDLTPGTNYVVVTALNLATGQSMLWINPGNESSTSVTATPDDATVAYPISDFELRESGGAGGGVTVSFVKVGKTFDSVFPSLNVQSVGGNVIVNWSDPTLGIQSTTNLFVPFADVPSATPPYTNNVDGATVFYRFGH